MPRLNAYDLETRRRRVIQSAQQCFVRSGYNGVTMRDIADRADLPLGSLYNYYEDKLALFRAVIESESNHFFAVDNEVVRYFLTSHFPNDLSTLAEAIRSSVKKYEGYFKLMYVDVVEFDGAHIRETFSNLDEKFKGALFENFKVLKKMGPKKIDPSFAFTTIYLSFYNYFILSQLFGAKNIYGRKTDQEVISGLIDMFLYGIGGRWQ